VDNLTYLLHLRVFLSFLLIIQDFDCLGKYILQPTRIIGSLLYSHYTIRPKINRIPEPGTEHTRFLVCFQMSTAVVRVSIQAAQTCRLLPSFRQNVSPPSSARVLHVSVSDGWGRSLPVGAFTRQVVRMCDQAYGLCTRTARPGRPGSRNVTSKWPHR
jgi:hypothetical protein